MILIRHGESTWNVHFGRCRIDPGIADPPLTAKGRAQAADAAKALEGAGLDRLVTSPYRRAVETAAIIADILGLDIHVEPLVRERCAFSCDQGSPPEELARLWPGLDFSGLDGLWWGEHIESHETLARRCARFRTMMKDMAAVERCGVVTHWGFIRGLTGESVGNARFLRVTAPALERSFAYEGGT